MADLSDVQDALAGLIVGAAYPNGTAQSPSISASMVRVYAGWPQPTQLDKDLRADRVNITVYGGTEKNTTRYIREWREISRQDQTIEAVVSGETITFTGTISVPQNVAVMVRGKVYIYGVQESDTLSTIAAALAALINVDTAASSTGAELTAVGLQAYRIGSDGVLAREIRRQEKQFMISVWAPSHELRVAAGKMVDGAISTLDQISLTDGTYGRVTYVRSMDNDDPQEALLYRRDIVFAIDFPTIETTDGTVVLGGQTGINVAAPDGFIFAQQAVAVGTPTPSEIDDEWGATEW